MAWTEQQTTVLVQRWEEGVSCRLIAEELGKTRNAVIGKANRLGLSQPFRPVWTDRLRADIAAKYQEGWTNTEIAESIGMSARAVTVQLSRLGVSKGQKPGPKTGRLRANG